MGVTNYHTINGRIVGQTKNGVRTHYVPDALGSVVATLDANGTVENTYRYKPYGSLLAKTGTGDDPRFLWVGTWGYHMASTFVYIRRRHFSKADGAWTSRDPLWPSQPPFEYGGSNPSNVIDPTGLFSYKRTTMCKCAPNDTPCVVMVITVEGSDALGIAWQPGASLQSDHAIEFCKSRFPKHHGRTLVINGTYFTPGPEARPSGPLKNCHGDITSGNDKDEVSVRWATSITFGLGYAAPRAMWRNGKQNKQAFEAPNDGNHRNIVKVESGTRRVVAFYLVESFMTAAQAFDCFPDSAAYPTGFEHFVNDGGSSTQAWLQQGDRVPPERISGAGTRFRLGNWYWLREKPPISETPG